MRLGISLTLVFILGCGGKSAPVKGPEPPGGGEQPKVLPQARGGKKMRVAFYNAGQALAALVALPNGKNILVDAGESPTRAGCGKPCKDWHARVLSGLAKHPGNAQIDLLWITYPHSDHLPPQAVQESP